MTEKQRIKLKIAIFESALAGKNQQEIFNNLKSDITLAIVSSSLPTIDELKTLERKYRDVRNVKSYYTNSTLPSREFFDIVIMSYGLYEYAVYYSERLSPASKVFIVNTGELTNGTSGNITIASWDFIFEAIKIMQGRKVKNDKKSPKSGASHSKDKSDATDNGEESVPF